MMITPQERRQEKTRQAILSTALQLIAEKGANKLSLREIARRIDYSPAGLYEYFGSKDEIIDAACGEANDRLRDYLQSVSQELPLREYLLELGLAYIKFARQHPEQFIFLFTNREIEPDAELQEYGENDVSEDDNFAILLRAVQKGVASGEIKLDGQTRPLDVAYSLWATVHGTAMLQVKYLSNFDFDFEHMDHVAIMMVIKGICSNK